MEEKEFDLFDYAQMIWKRKWLIIIGVFLCLLAAFIFSVSMPKVYEIDAVIQPAKFLSENEVGNLEEVVLEEPQQIADKVNHESYNSLIVTKLGLNEKDLSDIQAEHINETLLTRVWIKEGNKELGKKILNTLIELMRIPMDEKIEIELKNIDSIITENQIGKEESEKQVEILNKKLKVIENRKAEINKEMKAATEKLDELEKAYLNVLKSESKKSELEIMTILLYSTEILKSMSSYDLLSQNLRNEGLEEENVNLQIQTELAEIKQHDNEIANQKERKGRLDKTKIIKYPTASIDPVFPNIKLNLIVAVILGSMIFILLAFILEYAEAHKKKNKP
jgi:uncharacterized protein involved in exopolysaccharide biosynthesis